MIPIAGNPMIKRYFAGWSGIVPSIVVTIWAPNIKIMNAPSPIIILSTIVEVYHGQSYQVKSFSNYRAVLTHCLTKGTWLLMALWKACA